VASLKVHSPVLKIQTIAEGDLAGTTSDISDVGDGGEEDGTVEEADVEGESLDSEEEDEDEGKPREVADEEGNAKGETFAYGSDESESEEDESDEGASEDGSITNGTKLVELVSTPMLGDEVKCSVYGVNEFDLNQNDDDNCHGINELNVESVSTNLEKGTGDKGGVRVAAHQVFDVMLDPILPIDRTPKGLSDACKVDLSKPSSVAPQRQLAYLEKLKAGPNLTKNPVLENVVNNCNPYMDGECKKQVEVNVKLVINASKVFDKRFKSSSDVQN
ncbi:hypothetical protein U1Q18_022220, partial [Sarracenia purpurea var. burkii]